LLEEDIDLLWRIARPEVVNLAHFLDGFVKDAPPNSAIVAQHVGALAARVSKLESRGLIADYGPAQGMPIPKNVPPWSKKFLEKFYCLIPAGERLLRAIDDEPQNLERSS
jgi:hypothetical protein